MERKNEKKNEAKWLESLKLEWAKVGKKNERKKGY